MWRTRTSPSPGTPTWASSTRSTSGPPISLKRTASATWISRIAICGEIPVVAEQDYMNRDICSRGHDRLGERMEIVRAASLSGYFAVAEQLRLDVAPLLRRAGLTRAMISNSELMLPARSVVQLLEDSAETSGCITFGLRMAERRELSDLGLVSLLIVHQQTLADAIDVL